MAYKLPKIEAAIQMVDNVSAVMRGVRNSIEATNAPVNKLRNSMASLAREAQFDKLALAAGGLKNRMGGMADGAGKSFGRLQGVLLGSGGAVAGMGLLLNKTADAADAIFDTSKRIGVATDTLQKFRYAAKLAGSSVESADGGLERFAKGLSAARAGTGEALAPLQAMGIRLKDAAGKARPMEAVLLDISDALAKVPNEQDRLRASSALFGKGNQDFVLALQDGSKGLSTLFKEYQKMGGPISKKDLETAGAYNDTLDRLSFAAAGMASTFAVQLYPAVNQLLLRFMEWTSANRGAIESAGKWVATNLPVFVDKLTKSATTLAAQMGPIVRAMGWIMDKVGPLQTVLGGLAVFIAGPLVFSFLQAVPAMFTMGKAIFTTGRLVVAAFPAILSMFSALASLVTTTVVPGIYSVGVALLTTPVGWIVGGLALIGGAAFLLWKHWDAVSGWIMKAWGVVSAFLDTKVGKIVAAMFPFIGIPLMILKNWEPLKAFFISLWETIGKGAEKAAQFLKGLPLVGGFFGSIPAVGWSGGAPAAPQALGPAATTGAMGAVRNQTDTTASTILQKSSISVAFQNLPQGARVSEPTGNAPVSVSSGLAFGGGF